MQFEDPLLREILNKKRNIFNRLSDALYSFLDTLWGFKIFRISAYIGVVMLTILYLEIYYPKVLPTIVYSTIGIVSLTSDALQKLFKLDVFVPAALIMIISLLWRIASILEQKK